MQSFLPVPVNKPTPVKRTQRVSTRDFLAILYSWALGLLERAVYITSRFIQSDTTKTITAFGVLFLCMAVGYMSGYQPHNKTIPAVVVIKAPTEVQHHRDTLWQTKWRTVRDPHTTPTLSKRDRISTKEYISLVLPFAKAASRKTGVPVSIILAQAIVEGDSGNSTLARSYNNHFGHKCMSARCKKGHCVNRTDDSHKDFFRVYPNAAAAFDAHAKWISSGKYRSLKKHGNDYASWAKGLKAKGYATDPGYAGKLVNCIHVNKLDRYD